MVPLSWRVYVLNIILMLPPILRSEILSDLSLEYMQAFQNMFPTVDIKSVKVFDFVENPANLETIILMNSEECWKSQLKNKGKKGNRVIRSVYKLMGIPLDLNYDTTITPVDFRYTDADHYNYIDKNFYNHLNITSSEQAMYKNGWDYSPYIPEGESTTQFIFPSWNYGGKCPEVFWKDLTAHELDLVQSTVNMPDDILGYTDKDKPNITNFEQLYNVFWDTLYSIPHKCDNYTSLYKCLQGDPITAENMKDPYSDDMD